MIEDINLGYDKKNFALDYNLGSSEVISTPENVHDSWGCHIETMVENSHAVRMIGSEMDNLTGLGIAGTIDSNWILAGVEF